MNRLAITIMFLGSLGCRGPLPCDDCEQDAAENAAEDPISDLPCDGADLLTDDSNCGSCGNQCVVLEKDTPWEAGGCQDGECGPRWTDCESAGTSPLANCEEVCSLYGKACVARGCADSTALVFAIGFDDICHPEINPPIQTLAGSCTELLPWMVTDEYAHEMKCCCG